MSQYANTEECLQTFILSYFGDVGEACGRCSNCLDTRELQDITVDTQKVLSCVRRMNERFGKGLVAQVLVGSQVARIKQFQFDRLSTYGLMKGQSQKAVVGLIDYLTAAGYLQASGGQYPTLRVSALGLEVLQGQQQVFRKTALKRLRACRLMMRCLNNSDSYGWALPVSKVSRLLLFFFW